MDLKMIQTIRHILCICRLMKGKSGLKRETYTKVLLTNASYREGGNKTRDTPDVLWNADYQKMSSRGSSPCAWGGLSRVSASRPRDERDGAYAGGEQPRAEGVVPSP